MNPVSRRGPRPRSLGHPCPKDCIHLDLQRRHSSEHLSRVQPGNAGDPRTGKSDDFFCAAAASAALLGAGTAAHQRLQRAAAQHGHQCRRLRPRRPALSNGLCRIERHISMLASESGATTMAGSAFSDRFQTPSTFSTTTNSMTCLDSPSHLDGAPGSGWPGLAVPREPHATLALQAVSWMASRACRQAHSAAQWPPQGQGALRPLRGPLRPAARPRGLDRPRRLERPTTATARPWAMPSFSVWWASSATGGLLGSHFCW